MAKMTFVCNKTEIDSGQFSMSGLKALTKNTGAEIVIRGADGKPYGKIIKGVLNVFIDKSMTICEALRAVQDEIRA